MTTVKSKEKVVDLVDQKELLLLFRDYVNQCIEDFSFSNKVRPLSFDEWYCTIFRPNREDFTNIVTLEMTWEGAEGGYLSGSCGPEFFDVCIPHKVVTSDNGGIIDDVRFKRFAKKFADKMNRRLPAILYKGKRAYFWTWTLE